MKRFFIVLIATLIGTQGKAQQSKFIIGLEGGVSRATMISSNLSIAQNALRYSGGISLFYQLNNYISLGTGAYLEKKGFETGALPMTDINGIMIGKFQAHFEFNYMTVPLILRISSKGPFQIFANAGTYFGKLLQEKEWTTGAGVNDRTYYNTSRFNSFDLGIIFGIGVNYALNDRLLLNLEGRLNQGITSVSDVSSPSDRITHQTMLAKVGIGYKL